LLAPIGGQLGPRLCGAFGRLRGSEYPNPLVVAAVITVNVGRVLVVGRPEQDQLGTGEIITGGTRCFDNPSAGKCRMETVRRSHQLGSRVLEQLQLMMEMVD
jgi:hypothetical protein